MADSKKGRKVGNHKKHCEAYKSALKQERNKASRIFKHLTRNDRSINDSQSLAALKQVIGYLTPRRAQVIKALTA